MSLRKKNLAIGIAALMLGGLLYILLRGGSVVGGAVAGNAWVKNLRRLAQPMACDFLKYYLPDLLWGLSLGCCLAATYGKEGLLCPVIALGCGCVWEILQVSDLVSGTGDWLDVIMYLLGSALCAQINLKERSMKKVNALLMALLIALFAVFALGSSEGGSENKDQGKDAAGNDEIGKYSVVIDSCRLAEDYEGNPVVIVKYVFKNVADNEPASFYLTFDDQVYQNGVSLNGAYVLNDSANYSSSNQTKEIKKGASLEVEVAYELNDTTTDIEVEVQELFSLDKTVITKTFSIN